MNPKLKHLLLCAAGCQTALLFIVTIASHERIPFEIVMLISILIQGPMAVISSLIRPRGAPVSFAIGLAMGGVTTVLLNLYVATNYRG